MKQLDADYASGRVPALQYYQIKNQLIAADQQWNANMAAQAMAYNASVNQQMAQQNASVNTYMANQQMVNAYNARTMMMNAPRLQAPPWPQTVNVNGTLYLHSY